MTTKTKENTLTQKCKKIVKFVRKIYKTDGFIPLHEPRFRGNEKKYLNECIDSTFVSSVGKFVDMFEKKLCGVVGSKHCVATINGTSALHVALLTCGVKSGDGVITQALTFVATANAINYCGAKPVFVDVSKKTMGLSPKALKHFLEKNCEVKNSTCRVKKTNQPIRACVVMHTFGHPCEVDKIAKICKKWHIKLIEDGAESLGSFYKNKHTCRFGDVGIFSFNGNKIITGGNGGAIVTDDEDLAKKAKHLTTTAKVPHKWEYVHDEVGYNYRLSNLNASLLVAQLEELESFLTSKRELAKKYKKFFKTIDGVEFIDEPKNSKSNFWLNAILVKNRNKVLEELNKNNIMSRPVWKLLSELEIYKECQKDSLKNSKYFAKYVVNIPSSVV